MNEMTPVEPIVRHDGTYPTVPLRSPMVSIGIVQTPVRGVDGDDPEPGIKDNLAYLLNAIDKAQATGGRCDLLCFHEFPLHGFAPWDLTQYLRVSRHPDGPEIAAIGAKAKQYNCYIALGCQMLDDDWPGHTMNTQLLINPRGQADRPPLEAAQHARHVPGRRAVHDDDLRTSSTAMSKCTAGDQVVPVERTDIGNIAMSSVQFEPELFRCMALKGAELILRTATGGCEWHDMRLTAYHHGVYVTIVNNSMDVFRPSDHYFVEQAPKNDWVGRSAIFGPRGVVLAEADKFETKRRAAIPLEAYRKGHRIPDVHMALYRHVFDAYRERYDPNLWSAEVPETKAAAAAYLKDKMRWTSYWQG